MNKLNISKIVILGILGILLFTGCATSTQYISNEGSKTTTKAPITFGIDSRDFENAANAMITSMLESGALNKPDGSRTVILMSDIINDTTQRIDTRMLTAKIRRDLLRSGKAVFTNAIGTQRDDTTIRGTRSAREDDEFAQNTIAKKGNLISGDMGLSGRIIQRTARADNGDQVVEYYFQMQLTNATDGLAYWEDEQQISKIGSNKSVVWQ